MKGNLRAPILIIPVLVLVMAIGAFAAVVALNHSTAPTAEAVEGNIVSEPFGVRLTNNLRSLDLNGDADALDSNVELVSPVASPGDASSGAGPTGNDEVATVSGYVFTVRSDAAFGGGDSLLVTFPSDTDLVGGGGTVRINAFSGTHIGVGGADFLTDGTAGIARFTIGPTVIGDTVKNVTDGSSCTITAVTANTVTCSLAGGTDNDWDASDAYTINAGAYRIFDPSATALKDKKFKDTKGPVTADGQVLTIPAPPAMTAIVLKNNITVDIGESAKIINPTIPSSSLKLTVHTSVPADGGPTTSQGYTVGLRLVLTPQDPGDVAETKIIFFAKGNLIADDAKIILTFEDDWGFAGLLQTVPASVITIRADRISDGADVIFADGSKANATTGVTDTNGSVNLPTANRVARPSIAPSFSLVGAENDEPQLKITVPDMDPSETDNNTGSQGIAKNALVTVTLSSAAGIVNPTEAHTPFQFEEFHGHSIIVRETVNGIDPSDGTPAGDRVEIHLERILELNDDDAGKGRTITVLGKGFKNGTQATVFIDRNDDGILQKATESELARVMVDGDDTFTAQFVVDARFLTGRNNPINAVDGEGNSVCPFAVGTPGICDSISFKLEEGMSISPNKGNPGDEFNITLRDFQVDDGGVSEIASITLGGIVVLSPSDTTLVGIDLDSSGGATISAEIPNAAPEGTLVLSVTVITFGKTLVDEQGKITVGGSTVTVTPSSAVPNQGLTISGSGYSTGGGRICGNRIEIAGEIIADIPSDSRDGRTNLSTICTGATATNLIDFVDLTTGGTFVVTVPIPPVDSLLDAGINGELVEVKITDNNGRSGTTDLQIPERVLIVNPPESGTRSLLTIKGTGFPADNTEGATGFDANVQVKYVAENTTKTTSETPDTSGNFTVTMTVPTNAPIPSDNTVEGRITGSDGSVSVTTVIHVIPGGTVDIDPLRGPSGITVNVSGRDFKAFRPVDSLKFGGLGTLGGRAINTDSNGDFNITDILVPALEFGIHSVIVDVGQITANTTFEVLPSGLIGEPTPVADVYAMSDRPECGSPCLLRIFRFDNGTKTWLFNDPREDFEVANSLDELVSGGVYWLLIDQDVTLDTDRATLDLTCTGGDCWNLVAWP